MAVGSGMAPELLDLILVELLAPTKGMRLVGRSAVMSCSVSYTAPSRML